MIFDLNYLFVHVHVHQTDDFDLMNLYLYDKCDLTCVEAGNMFAVIVAMNFL